jgi:Competence-damaged protein
MFSTAHLNQATALLTQLRAAELKLATAESCTGGLIAGLLTEIAGSSDVLERGYVTYSNAAKSEALGVTANLIADHGAVSAEVARAMAQGWARTYRGRAAWCTGSAAGTSLWRSRSLRSAACNGHRRSGTGRENGAGLRLHGFADESCNRISRLGQIAFTRIALAAAGAEVVVAVADPLEANGRRECLPDR